jgi:ribosomal-protein-alanine N-acetyltransferase
MLRVLRANQHSSMNEFKTPRLRLINADPSICEAIVRGDDVIAKHLQVVVANPWTEFGIAPFQYTLSKIYDDPTASIWWSWLPVHMEDNTLIGNSGYKGPAVDGVIEIGYEVAEAYRGKGFATEIAKALIDRAFSFPEIHTVQAHTLAEENASVRVLKKCGFVFIEEIQDPDDGKIWKWMIRH